MLGLRANSNKKEKIMKVYLKFKDGSIRRAHFKIMDGFWATLRIKVSSEGKRVETYLLHDEYLTLKAGGMVTVEEVDIVMRKFCSRESLEKSVSR
jgi:hypothetical protein